MKKGILLLGILMLVTYFSVAQKADYKVVFDLASKDTMNQLALLREMKVIKETSPHAQIEAVLYGKGLSLVTRSGSKYSDMIKALLSQKDVSLKVCSISMKKNHIEEDQLLPGVEIVPDGIYEIISKQQDGWGYIKVAN